MQTLVSRRRFVVRALVGAAAPGVLLRQSLSQASQGVHRVVIGYPAGGSVDVVGRTLGEYWATSIGRTVVVENKPGAAGRLAIDALKNAPADGSTLLITPASVLTMYPHIYKNLGYDVFNDLAPVGIVAVTRFVLVVGPLVPPAVRTVEEFAAWCRNNPDGARCGNPGAGSLPHFMAMLWAEEAKVPLGHIPYRGGLPAMLAAASGEIASALATESSALALEQAGKLRALATSGTERSIFLPNAPTFREAGYVRLSQREWFGAFMPAKTPSAAIESTAETLRTTLREADVIATWHRLALLAEGSNAPDLAQALRTEHDFWAPIIRASGFTPEA